MGSSRDLAPPAPRWRALSLPRTPRSPAQDAKKPPKAKKAAPAKKPAATWSAARAPKPAPAEHQPRALTPKEQRFAEEYLVDLNGTQAYLRSHAGVTENTARTEGSRLLANPDIQAAVARGREELSRRTGISAEKALAEAWAVATADARELVDFVVGACRFCHGLDHGYQRTQAEYDRDLAEFQAGSGADEWDSQGGVGFNPNAAPHPECPECFGRGHGRTYFKDTRALSPAAAALYAGVKQTKEGLEVKMHSKLDALEKVFKHLGLYEKDNNQKVDPLAALLAGMGRSAVPVVQGAGDA